MDSRIPSDQPTADEADALDRVLGPADRAAEPQRSTLLAALHALPAQLRLGQQPVDAEARRLQPHYIEAFFLEAFKQLGGTAIETLVICAIRNLDSSVLPIQGPPGTGKTYALLAATIQWLM
mgnify:CR=1 FL=1